MEGSGKKVNKKNLSHLFKIAEEQGLWFYSHYQQMWFSPRELKEQQSRGHFVWGAVNWELRDPKIKLKQFEREIEELEKQKKEFELRLQKGK